MNAAVRRWGVGFILWIPFAGVPPLAMAAAGDPVLPPLLHDLGNRLAIAATSSSWAELCANERPTFTWRDRDLIWVENDPQGAPLFRLDCAYRYRDGNGEIQWVLLGLRDGEWDRLFGQVMGDNLVARPQLVAQKPTSDHGSGDYVVELATDERCGAIYEVGWQKLMANGTSLEIEERRLYFRWTRGGAWEFLGEGQGEGQGKSGPGASHVTRSVPKVTWSGDSSCSCRIEFLMEHRDYRWWTEADGEDFNRDLPPVTVRYERATLDSVTRRLEMSHAPSIAP
jgi:hypothetical protein